MTNIKLILICLIVSSVFLGCVQPPPQVGTPTPTATPTTIETVKPTVATPVPTPTPTPARVPSVYKTFVDEDYGFKRAIETSYKQFEYQNLTLNISVGDTVIWVNDATSDEKLTILSEQNLWSNTSAILRWNYQSFNYTFIQPGTYGVYIKEYPSLRHQRIVVNP